MNDVWVVAEHDNGELREVTLEVLGDAGKLAQRLGTKVAAVLVGYRVAQMADTLGHYGADEVYLLNHELLAEPTAEVWASILVSLVREHRPSILILPATSRYK